MDIQSSITHDNQKLEQTQMFINRCMTNDSYEKEWITDSFYSVDETWKHHAL